MILHLVRHLAPLAPPGSCYGRSDLAVDPAVQAAALPSLRTALPAGVPVYASPLRRCATLATALYGSAVRIDARLAELDFGSWELCAWDAIPRAAIDAWAADMAGYRPGGGESVLEMAQRVSAFYDEVLALGEAEAVVICHAGTIRLLAARARGRDPLCMAREAASAPHAIAYGAVIRLDCV